jgi:thymidylate kinase
VYMEQISIQKSELVNLQSEMPPVPEREKLPSYVVVEGNAGSGKSTVLKVLQDNFNFSTVGEYGDFVDFKKGENFPVFPPQSNFDVIQSNHLWLKLELKRRSDMIFKSFRGLPILMDRSPLSLFAFEYAKMNQGFPSEFANLAGRYCKLIDLGISSEPVGFVILNTDPAIIQQRIVSRGGRAIPFLFNRQTIQDISKFLEYFAEQYVHPHNYLIIDNKEHTPEETAKIISSFNNGLVNRGENSIRQFLQSILIGDFDFSEIAKEKSKMFV